MPAWRGGRVVEGARLESAYTVMSRIVGSNPTPSATKSMNLENLCFGLQQSLRIQAARRVLCAILRSGEPEIV